jgi:hypothetical protein
MTPFQKLILIPTLTITTLGVLVLGWVMMGDKQPVEIQNTTFTTQQVKTTFTVSWWTTMTTIDPNTCMTTEIPVCKKRFWKDLDSNTCKQVVFEVDCMFYDEVSKNEKEFNKLLTEYWIAWREEGAFECSIVLDTITTYGYVCSEEELGNTKPDTNTKWMCRDNSRTCKKVMREWKEILLREKNLGARYDPTGKTEICDGRDNDCDWQVDEWYHQKEYLRDFDGDGWGNLDMTTKACFPPPWHVLKAGDCDDLDKEVYPGAYELCDGIDNNCNMHIDEWNVCELVWLGAWSCSFEAIEIAKKNIGKALAQCKQTKQKPIVVTDYKKFWTRPLSRWKGWWEIIVNHKAVNPLDYLILAGIFHNLNAHKFEKEDKYWTFTWNLTFLFSKNYYHKFKTYWYENIDIIMEGKLVKVYKIRTFMRDELLYTLTFKNKQELEVFISFFNLLKSNNEYIDWWIESLSESLLKLHSKDYKWVYKLLNVSMQQHLLSKWKSINWWSIIDEIKEYIDQSLWNISDNQKVCFTSCVTNYLLDYQEETNDKDISWVINDWVWNCVNYQQVAWYIYEVK